ncbi:hypothetical protein IGW68_07490 [Shewanella benthica]|uniref:hypothetical protein n=1 Tax=Shewanella benthica TaxID=43661 RepID=UPI0018791424|nr:hypothetical protein [Shewanella benthica]MBE7215002.1 hypothetical protein [Shewanella benthica]
MTLSKGNMLAVVLLLLAFIGQAVAAAGVPCQMNMQITSLSNLMDMDSGAQFTHGDMDASSQSGECDDCDQICTCPMNGCASMMVLVTNLTPSELLKASSVQIVSNNFSIQTPYPATNYRPPITC